MVGSTLPLQLEAPHLERLLLLLAGRGNLCRRILAFSSLTLGPSRRGRSVSPIRPARYASPWPEVFPTLPHSLPPTQHYSTLFSQSNLPPQTLLLANLPPALVGTDVLDLLGSKLRPYIEQIAFNLVGLDQMDARVVLRGRTRAAIDELARALDRCQVLDRRIRSSVE